MQIEKNTEVIKLMNMYKVMILLAYLFMLLLT